MPAASRPSGSGDKHRPVVAQYCATFLKPEMFHIYRQIVGLRRYRGVVFAQKRENPERFPFDQVLIVPKPRLHAWRRFWVRQVLQSPPRIFPSEVRRLTGALDEADAALLHIYFGNIGVHLLPLIRTSPVPVVVSFHGADAMIDMEKTRFRSGMSEMLRSVDLVLVRSKSLGDRVTELGCAPEKLRVHRTGIPLETFSFRVRAAPVDGRWRFLQACRLIEKKGLGTSMRAFAQFAARHPHATFTIAGSGPLDGELRALAGQLRVDRQVKFAGFLSEEELKREFYETHAFVHPSQLGNDGNQEGVPNSMLEAMATGLPVLATTHGGIPEAAAHGVTGFLVAEKDDAALADAMEQLCADGGRYAKMSAAASAAVTGNFELNSQIAALEDFYDEAILRGRGSKR